MKNIASQLGTFLIVTVVTLLVWLYAEDANVQSYTQQAVRIEFVLPEGVEGLITPSEPITVLVDFDGSNGQFQQFDDVRDEVIKVELPINLTEDMQEIPIDLRSEIEQADRLKQLGINVTSVSPEREAVTFERVLDVTLDVKIRQRTGSIKLAAATFTEPEQPPRITFRKVPASQATQLSNAFATAWINEQDVATLDKGTPHQMTVSLELPDELDGLQRSISTVDLLVTVADDRDTVKIDRRPILLSYPPSINERYIIELEESDRFVTAFELEGPRDQIVQIKDDPATKDVWATVRFDNEEADAAVASGGVISKAVTINAPDGVVLASEVVRINIKVTSRETPAAP
ncbi:MAG: hypothetical protein AAGB26_01835 [Planctomycetota bacterium]